MASKEEMAERMAKLREAAKLKRESGEAFVREKSAGLLPEEREYIFGGSCSDEWMTVDIAKCAEYGRHIRKWRRAVEEEPESVKLTYEDRHHIIFKVLKKRVKFPLLKPKRAAAVEAEED